MKFSDSPINLQLIPINQQTAEFHFKKGEICLFITHDQAIQIPFNGKTIPMPGRSIYLFYDQNTSFDLSFTAIDPTTFCVITLPIDTLHGIIAQGTDGLNYAQEAFFGKERYHHFEPANSEIQNHVNVLIENPQNLLLIEAKKFEILNEYFNTITVQTYKCPFLNQKDNVIKVRDAKKLLISNLQESPSIKELSKAVGLNEYNLKTGFKEIYGKPIFSFLKDYKIAKSRDMIITKEFQISEIAYQMGYSNVSHFIDAFKKKYGITPKKFELSLP